MNLTELIEKYSDQYLICDTSLPLITNGTVSDELQLYHINAEQKEAILAEFNSLTGKKINPDSSTTTLSGGQKVILMLLAALYCPAPRILVHNIHTSLDNERADAAKALIDKFRTQKTEILELNDALEA